MKVAVQISGRQRYGTYFAEFQNALATTFGPVDFFIHNWSDKRSAAEITNLVQFPHKVAKIEVVPQIPFFIDPKWDRAHGTAFNVVSMLYGIQAVNKLRHDYQTETGAAYDLVIRARSDIKLVGFPVDPTWLTADDDLQVYVGKRPHYLPKNLPEVQDQFAIGRPEAMDVYANMYDGIKADFEPLHPNSKTKFHPETYVFWWLYNNMVSMDETTFSVLLENDHIDRKQRATY